MKRFSRSLSRNPRAGFTMVEFISILLVLTILAAFFIPRFDTETPTAINDLNVLRAHIRYAQLKAMGDIVPWGLNLQGDRYTLERNGTTAAGVDLPGVNDTTYVFETDNLTVSTLRIAFDPRGRPLNFGSSSVLTADQVINVSPSDYGTIVITQQTGFIQ